MICFRFQTMKTWLRWRRFWWRYTYDPRIGTRYDLERAGPPSPVLAYYMRDRLWNNTDCFGQARRPRRSGGFRGIGTPTHIGGPYGDGAGERLGYPLNSPYTGYGDPPDHHELHPGDGFGPGREYSDGDGGIYWDRAHGGGTAAEFACPQSPEDEPIW